MQETWVQSLGWKDSPGEGKGYPLQYSGLENSMDYTVHGVTKSQTRLSDFLLTPWKESYDQPRQHIENQRYYTLPTKVHLVKVMVFPMVMYGCESRTVNKAEPEELMLLNCGVGEDSWESLGLQGDPTSPF